MAGGAHLLWDEAGGGHAGCSVDFEHVDAVVALGILGDDIVDAYDAVAVQDVIDAAGLLGHSTGYSKAW